MEDLKVAVRDFWDAASCGEVYAVGDTLEAQFAAHSRARYELEPYIREFAGFDGSGKDVLEVGVGMGADHVEWAKSRPNRLAGVDFTPRAVEWTSRRIALAGLSSQLQVGDAENLPFPGASFDLVYSWGVLHHTPNTPKAFREIHRVLRPGGEARIMIYHRPSIVGFLLWAQYGALARRPFRSLTDIYAHHLESPGTKGYTIREGRRLAQDFRQATVKSAVSFGDLLEGEVGQRHSSAALGMAKRVWPRPLVRRLSFLGLMLEVRATK